jgi:hypothetical protein
MTEATIPEEFIKVIKDFINDIKTTFPEYTPLIQKWWDEADEQGSVETLFEFCQRKIPPRFFDILYQNESMFEEESDLDTEFLPFIHFKNLWSCDITKGTRETIWKYLQLIMFSIIGTIRSKESFGDTAKLFENIDQEEFKNKLEETIGHIQKLVDLSTKGKNNPEDQNDPIGPNSEKTDFGINMDNMPNADEIHSHITGMLDGKLGKLAREIAEETASNLNMDFEGETDMAGIFQKLVSNPGQMMGLVKSVGEKLDTKLKSGDLKETELITEATNIMNQMKNMPGMDNIQSMLHKFGMSGMGDMAGMNGKVNVGAMEAQLNNRMKIAKTKERIRAKAEANARAKALQQAMNGAGAGVGVGASAGGAQSPLFSDEEIIKLFSSVEKGEKTPRTNKKGSKK